jgi:hypothetical protein
MTRRFSGMNRYYAICLGLGLASGLMNISVIYGGAPAIAFNFFAGLPLFFLGLGLGTRAVVIGAIIGAATTLLAGFGLLASYLLVSAVPAVVLTRQAILARQDANGVAQWYPLGNLLMILAGLVAVNILAAHFLASGQAGGLAGEFASQLRQILKFLETQGGPAVSDADREQTILFWSRLMMVFHAMVLMFSLVINGALAQEILRRMKMNIRPTADIVDLALPQWASIAFALAIAATLAPAPLRGFGLGALGLGAVGLGFAAYFLQGLAVLHTLARRWRKPDLALIGCYVLLFVVGWLIGLVAILGLLDSLFGFRRRLLNTTVSGTNNDQEDE